MIILFRTFTIPIIFLSLPIISSLLYSHSLLVNLLSVILRGHTVSHFHRLPFTTSFSYHLKFGLPDLPLRIRPVSMGTCTHNHCSFSPFKPSCGPVSHFGSSSCYLPSLPSCFQATVGHFGPLSLGLPLHLFHLHFYPRYSHSPLFAPSDSHTSPFLHHYTLSTLLATHSPGYSLSLAISVHPYFHLRLLHHGAASHSKGSTVEVHHPLYTSPYQKKLIILVHPPASHFAIVVWGQTEGPSP